MIKIEVHSTRAVVRSQEPLTVGLRGAKVRFSFGSPWEGLSKIAVFRQGEKTVTVADVGEEVIIPWEVLTQPGSPVQIGVYGIDSTDTVAIPTVWTETAAVRPGADPEGDPSTEPTPGLWEQLQGKMGSLGRLNTATKDSLVGAINEATRAFCLVTVTKNEDGSYSADKTSQQLLTAKNMGKVLLCQLDSLWLTLSSVYNTATFEFTTVKKNTKCCITIHPDGTISYQADVLATGESRLPNPKKITITGASTAEYDGSDEVEVQVPYKTSQLENDSGFLTTATAPVTSVNGQTGEVKLPTVVKVPLIRQEDGTYKPGISHEDILAAYNAGNIVFCEYSGRLLPLIVASTALCSFGCVHSGNVYTVNITRASTVASIVPLASGGGSGSGSDGITPHIGANGNWFIGETDTGMPSQGEDGADGQVGKDGTSPTVSVSDITGGHRITITDANGTKTVDVMDGADGNTGQDGQNGSDGVGIASIEQTAVSTADGGDNVFTVTLTNGNNADFTVKNGSKGNTGATGPQGEAGLQGPKGEKGDTGDTGPAGKDGSDYVLTSEDLEEIATLAAMKVREDTVLGSIDENNNILLSGSLADGTYVLKYRNEDGAYTEVGTLEVGSVTETYTNLADPTSADWQEGYRLSISSGGVSELAGHVSTNYIHCKAGNVLRVKGLNLIGQLTTDGSGNQNNAKIVMYDGSKSVLGGLYGLTTEEASANNYGAKVDVDGDISTYTVLYNNEGTQMAQATCEYIRIDGALMDGYTSEDVIITINEKIV